MEPVLQRLGDVTIQRLEKPKEPVKNPPSTSQNTLKDLKAKEENEDSEHYNSSEEESGEDYDDPDDENIFNHPGGPSQPTPTPKPPIQNPLQDLKRSLPSVPLGLGPEITFKKFKVDIPETSPQKPAIKPAQQIPAQNPVRSLQNSSVAEENEPSISDDEMSYYDSELESEGELQDLGSDLGLNMSIEDMFKTQNLPQEKPKAKASAPAPATNPPSTEKIPSSTANVSTLNSFSTQAPTAGPNAPSNDEEPNDDNDENSDEDETSFFEKLVEQAEVPPATPSSEITVKSESPDEDYDVDIKEKLKEMGEITFASVKKGDKPKNNSDPASENEVVIRKKSGEEVTVLSKGNLRRNIREVMDETKLDEVTLAAQRQEAERLKRVQEQQRILREYQRQAQQERMQQRVMSLLQGNNFPPKPGAANQTRIGDTVLMKLPNGQTKPITKVPRPPFDPFLKMPKPESAHSRYPGMHGLPPMGPMGMMGPMGAPRGYPKPHMPRGRGMGHLPSSFRFSPMHKRGHPFMPARPHQSDSDSESEERRRMFSPAGRRGRKGKAPNEQSTIEVSSDDDCIVVSESEADQNAEEEDEPDDPSNSGMHTNDEFNQPDEQGRVLVNVGHPDDEPDVFVAPQIARIIKPHQIGGVRFLYDNIIETVTKFDPMAGFGCILAHSMGLGKTLQIVTFSDVFLRYTPCKTILCIMPINTLQNWMAEFNMWTPSAENAVGSPLNAHGEVRPRNFDIHVLNDGHKTLVARQKVIHAWRTQGGILLIGYEQFRLLSMKKHPKSKRKGAMPAPDNPDDFKNKHIFDEIYTSLVNPGPDLVICDEGHRIKNSHASISAALKQLRTKRRVVLTGYPLQNNLTEYWCMVDFVRPNYLGSKTEFLNMFERPIMNGQCIDSTEADIKLMRYRAHVLHSLLVGFVQRRSHTVLQTVLPQKEEYVLLVRLTPFQRKLYDTFMNVVVRTEAVPNPLKAFAVCCKIWNHPDVLYNFLVKRTKGDAVDLDLEEVASTVSGVTSTSTPDTKPKRGPGKPRKTPTKAQKGKPAASITPYNSNVDSMTTSMQPPTSSASGSNLQPPTETRSQFNSGNTTTFSNTFSNAPKSAETNYGPYTDEYNQPRTSFEGISQFFDDHLSQSYDSPFDENAQFSPFPTQSPTGYSQTGEFQQQDQSFQQNGPFTDAISSTSSNPHQPPSNQTSLFNMDSQNTVTVNNANPVKSNPNIPCLPSGISLTPLGSKGPQNPPTGNSLVSQTPDSGPKMTGFSGNQQNLLPDPQYNMDQRAAYEQNNFGPQQNYWEPERKPELNQPGPNNSHAGNNLGNANFPYQNNPTPWMKKEELSPVTPNHLSSPQKSESSNDSKPKIKIISDIKLPSVFSPDKKINIISDIKIEPKKEEKDDKDVIKTEVEMLKNELQNELKIEDEVKPPAPFESPLSKLTSLPPLKDSKEDVIPYDWALDLLRDYVPGLIENSAKFQILFCIIRESLALGDRLLVFSQSLITLDLIEQFLQASQIPGETQKWAKNVSYYRLDGSTGAQEREKLINEFNSNPKIHVFLVSTRAGSLGINLIGANRVVVLDASWNPCHDTQAVCRVYRYGQRKPCFVYRLVVDNCLEKKIYDRQVSKQGMSDRVVDECNPDAHLTMKDVSTLCFDDKKDEGELKDWSCCKDKYIDVVLQKVLDLHGTAFTKEPFQHESLLVDRKEKQLSQQEKRLAKKGYEREKNAARQPAYLSGSGRGHRPVASVRPMQQGNERPSRWIPAEHWQRQGMTAQEMTLPLDVVIPTNQPEKGNIVLKAGQKVLVLKSPKGVYMQLESGKIVAIKTAIKVKGKADENPTADPMKLAAGKMPPLPPQMKNNPSLSVIPQKRLQQQQQQQQKHLQNSPSGPIIPGLSKVTVKSIQKPSPNLVSKTQQGAGKKMQSMPVRKPETINQPKEGDGIPGSSSEDENLPMNLDVPPVEQQRPELEKPVAPSKPPDDELEKQISQLKKNISIQRITPGGIKQPLVTSSTSASQSPVQPKPVQPKPVPRNPLQQKPMPVQKSLTSQENPLGKPQKPADILGKSILDNTPFQETLESITAGFKNPDNIDDLDSEDDEDDEERREIEEDEDEPMSDMEPTKEGEDERAEHQEGSDQSDEVTYVSEQPGTEQYPNQRGNLQKTDGSDYNASTSGYNYNYNYNVPPYQGHPPPQGYVYPPQPPPTYDGYNAYPHAQQPPYQYGYQGYVPPTQPHYPPPPPQPGYDYSNPQPPIYPNYPYPQQYPPPPQAYPPPPASSGAPANFTDYSQYSNQSQSSSGNYFQNS
ncbi:uncharacterized protein LOC126740238 [Anthonomus grandis grandis]|uniref:uncharacterized protein LOC126740238 n=1 Tax=Anthonomus grandis grandis TaxID=2921223 RepID=UPI002165CDFE|nr:uncharacterized protein LOC126740238 [Anthonomus grandis grandis]XP_050302245.1 uncharacterized protein LOC126740238 [Anthonomus grandis grandis]